MQSQRYALLAGCCAIALALVATYAVHRGEENVLRAARFEARRLPQHSVHRAGPHGSIEYDVTLFYHSARILRSSDMPNITLASHITIDRLNHLARWCRTLRGPMSISVFVRPQVDDLQSVMSRILSDDCIAAHADVHLVREHLEAASPPAGSRSEKEKKEGEGKDMMTHYPFNVQRNAALDGCVGDLALLMDIDFHLMPSAIEGRGEESLRAHLNAQRAVVASWPVVADEPWVADAAAYVIPAVETVVKELPLPTTVEELRHQNDLQIAVPFYGHYCKFCHRPTDLKRFLQVTDDAPYLVDYEDGYEPYVVVNRSSLALSMLPLPRYDESFVGRGWDKMSFFFEIAEQRRPFVVVPKFFIVHSGRGDLPSFFRPQSAEYRDKQTENRRLMDTFKEEKRFKYRHVAFPSSFWGSAIEHASKSSNRGEIDDTDGKASSSSGSSPRIGAVDVLLWDASRQIDWSELASSSGFSVVCIAKNITQSSAQIAEAHWAAAFASEAVAGSAYTRSKDQNETSVSEWRLYEEDSLSRRLREAVWWACSHMNCNGLLERNGSALSAAHDARGTAAASGTSPAARGDVTSPLVMEALRHAKQPYLGADALWIFDRWFHRALGQGALAWEACNFLGTAELVTRRQSLRGCTVDPRREFPVALVESVIADLCSDSIPFRLGSARCDDIVSRIHPLVRRHPRTRLSVLLNAHHLIYEAGERGTTCELAFPSVAVPTPWGQQQKGTAQFQQDGDEGDDAILEDGVLSPLLNGEDAFVTDPLLLRATTQIDWNAVASNGHGLFPIPVDVQLEVTNGRSCIAAFRTPITNPSYNRTEAVEELKRMEVAMSWACGRMNCGQLQVDRVTGPWLRHYPRNIVPIADWIFGRWFYEAILSGEAVSQACHFGGAARLAKVTPLSGRLVPVESDNNDASGNSKRTTHLVMTALGCTLNPEFPSTRTMLMGIVRELCSDPPPLILSDEEADETGRAEEGAAADRIGGGCQALFSRMDPAFADDWRMKASVVLNAHHLIFFAGGEGRTCRRRFGPIASYLRV